MVGRKSTGPPPTTAAFRRPKKHKPKRAINALAIAEAESPEKIRLRKSRFGESEPIRGKRKRDDDEDESSELDGDRSSNNRRRKTPKHLSGENAETYSDSSGNEWTVGAVDDGDDSDLDSDEAFGESDEEKFEGFTFRGSSSFNKKQHQGQRDQRMRSQGGDMKNTEYELDENDEGRGANGSESDLGSDAIDLADVLDDNSDSSSVDSKAGSEDGMENEPKLSSDEDEESMLAISEDEDEMANKTKLASLQALASTLGPEDANRAKSRKSLDTGDALDSIGLDNKSGKKLTIADLMPTITDPTIRNSLKILAENDAKPSSKRTGIARKLEVPLPKRQQDKIDRAAAYEKSKEALSRWIETVKHNRRADHLSFPLQNSGTTPAPGARALLSSSQSKPMTVLEDTIQSILQDNGVGTSQSKSMEQEIKAFEELKANDVPFAQVQARRSELRRARDLLFREEIRAKRIKKIKSKAFRKVHRKEREKNFQLEKEAMIAAGVEESESEKEKMDRQRAEERMGARHRESKWAKGMKASGRVVWDTDARGGVMEMARRADDLKRRIEGKEVHNSDSGSDSDENTVDEDVGENALDELQRPESDLSQQSHANHSLANMDFMKRAEAIQKAKNDDEREDLRLQLLGEEKREGEVTDEGIGRRSYGPSGQQQKGPKEQISSATDERQRQKSEFEEKEGSDDDFGAANESWIDEDVLLNDTLSKSNNTSQSRNPASRHQARLQSSNKSNRDSIANNPWLSSKSDARSKRMLSESDAAVMIANDAILEESFPDSRITIPAHSKPVKKSTGRNAKNFKLPLANGESHTEEDGNNHNNDDDNDDDYDNEVADDDVQRQPILSRNQELIRRAFAGDAVVADFEAEKQATVRSEAPKVVDTTLPGWGSWTGLGLSRKDVRHAKGRRTRVKEAGIEQEKRKDAKLDRVIINERQIKKNARYLANQLPHPFETRQQYERSLRLPVGPEWTTKETFQDMTKPRIMIKQGVIAPMIKPMV